MKKSNQIDQVIEGGIKNLKSLIDVDTVVGSPFTSLDGTVIVPVSKVTTGFIVGGGEYEISKKSDELPMTAGTGGYVQLSPIGFLVGQGANMHTITIEQTDDSLSKIVQLAGNVLEK